VCNQSVTANNQVTAEQCEQNEALSFEHSSLILESNPVDVGTVIKKILAGEPVSDSDKRACLTNRWHPANKDETVFSEHKMKGRCENVKRYLGIHYLDQFKWLAVSKQEGFTGAWCVYCSLFNVTGTGGGHHSVGGTSLGALVRQPLASFKDLVADKGNGGSLTNHCTTRYHLSARIAADDFLQRTGNAQPTMSATRLTRVG
jgi:hypothetical protein